MTSVLTGSDISSLQRMLTLTSMRYAGQCVNLPQQSGFPRNPGAPQSSVRKRNCRGHLLKRGIQRQVSLAVATETDSMQTVDVSLGDRSYPIYIGQGLLDRSDLLQQHILGKKVLIVTNEIVAPIYLERHVLCWPAVNAD